MEYLSIIATANWDSKENPAITKTRRFSNKQDALDYARKEVRKDCQLSRYWLVVTHPDKSLVDCGWCKEDSNIFKKGINRNMIHLINHVMSEGTTITTMTKEDVLQAIENLTKEWFGEAGYSKDVRMYNGVLSYIDCLGFCHLDGETTGCEEQGFPNRFFFDLNDDYLNLEFDALDVNLYDDKKRNANFISVITRHFPAIDKVTEDGKKIEFSMPIAAE